MKWIILLVIPLLVAGCASLDTMKLSEAMNKQEVQALFGKPNRTHFNRVGGNSVEVWDYTRSDQIHGGAKEVRLWFLNDKLKIWQSEEWWDLVNTPKLRIPPDFESPNAPDFILEIRKKDMGKNPSDNTQR